MSKLKTLMTATATSLAGITAALPAPALAQAAPNVAEIIVYGTDPCPRSTDDQVVVPPSSADLDGALDFTVQSVCPGLEVTHGDLPRTPAVIAAVTRELAVAEPAVPGPEIC